MSVIPEGPAAKAGVHASDEVVAVDGKPTQDLTLQPWWNLLKGGAGSWVSLTLRREGVADPLVLRMMRAKVDVPNVQTEILPGNIGYLWLRTFNKQADREAREGLENCSPRTSTAWSLTCPSTAEGCWSRPSASAACSLRTARSSSCASAGPIPSRTTRCRARWCPTSCPW